MTWVTVGSDLTRKVNHIWSAIICLQLRIYSFRSGKVTAVHTRFAFHFIEILVTNIHEFHSGIRRGHLVFTLFLIVVDRMLKFINL